MATHSRVLSLTVPDASQLVKSFFEPRLVSIGLGETQIQKQTLEELEQSLDRINDEPVFEISQ